MLPPFPLFHLFPPGNRIVRPLPLLLSSTQWQSMALGSQPIGLGHVLGWTGSDWEVFASRQVAHPIEGALLLLLATRNSHPDKAYRTVCTPGTIGTVVHLQDCTLHPLLQTSVALASVMANLVCRYYGEPVFQTRIRVGHRPSCFCPLHRSIWHSLRTHDPLHSCHLKLPACHSKPSVSCALRRNQYCVLSLPSPAS